MSDRRLHLMAMVLCLSLLSSCFRQDLAGPPFIDLGQRETLPIAAAAEILPLRMAVAAIISPQGTVESYGDLASYLSMKTGRPVELVQRRTYAEINHLVAEQMVDLAFVCTSAYVTGRDGAGMQLLVAPEIRGESVYHSALIVHRTNPARSMADLRGAIFAFTDPMSFSGRTYPTYLVQGLGGTPGTFFQRTVFTYSHDRAIEAVAAGVVDAAAVDSLVLDYALQRDPSLARRIQIIHRSPPFGIPPVVIPSALPPRQKVQLREALLQMDRDDVGQEILDGLGIDRFVLLDDEAYTGARTLVRKVEGSYGRTH